MLGSFLKNPCTISICGFSSPWGRANTNSLNKNANKSHLTYPVFKRTLKSLVSVVWFVFNTYCSNACNFSSALAFDCKGSNLSTIIFTIASANSPDSLLNQSSQNCGVHSCSPPPVSIVPVSLAKPNSTALSISGFLISSSSSSLWSLKVKSLPGNIFPKM